MPKAKLFSHCAVSKCETKYDGRISFFRFPKDNYGRCIEWLRLCGRLDLIDKDCNYLYNKLRVCGKHFKENMFQNNLRNRLLPNAKPTYFIPSVTLDSHNLKKSVHQDSLIDVQDDSTNERVASCSTSPYHLKVSPRSSSFSRTPVQIPQYTLMDVQVDPTVCEPVASCSTAPYNLEISSRSERKSPIKSPMQTQTQQIFSNRTPRKNVLRGRIKNLQE